LSRGNANNINNINNLNNASNNINVAGSFNDLKISTIKSKQNSKSKPKLNNISNNTNK
jgi:hypothetical protein